ncbi:uncharacterized protein LOC121835888 [Ixodes scapularis]|uniref:uncharacterized protein LOC121835888 n=1 Tax=Ixodes scapularis TaxID=6945 RepID=UPI001C38FB43|nr:uncharacterized protein LOC121835888 [Ixodes scapularis]
MPKFMEFKPEEDDVDGYLERFEIFLRVNAVKTEDKAVTLLNYIGKASYQVLKTLLVPDSPVSKSCDVLSEVLKRHYAPKRLVIAARTKFHWRNQEVGESLADFSLAIKKLAQTCAFKDYLDQALRERLVAGCRDFEVQRTLIQFDDDYFHEVLKVGLAKELSLRKMDEIRQPGVPDSMDVHRVQEYNFKVLYRKDGELGDADALSRLPLKTTVGEEIPLQPWKMTSRVFERVHLDFATKSGTNLFVLVDSFSKWVEVLPMSSTTAPQTVEKLMAVFAQFGVPEEVVTDGGPQFRSEEFKNFLKDQGVVHTMTPPYPPASNGAAERAVQTVKRALLKQVLEDDLQGKRRNIHEKLSCFLLAYRTTPHTSTGKEPAELFLGRLPRTRLSQLKPGATSLPRREKQNKKKELADKRRGPTKLLQVGDRVWVRNPLRRVDRVTVRVLMNRANVRCLCH